MKLETGALLVASLLLVFWTMFFSYCYGVIAVVIMGFVLTGLYLTLDLAAEPSTALFKWRKNDPVKSVMFYDHTTGAFKFGTIKDVEDYNGVYTIVEWK